MRCFLFLVVCLSHPTFAQDDSSKVTDSELITKAAMSYQKAFNAKDAEALAAHFTADAEMAVGTDVLKGRDAIKADYVALFKSDNVPTLKLEDIHVSVISPSVAIETGTAILSNSEVTETTTYRAVHVKEASGWLLDRVQDEVVAEPPPSNYDQLKALEWLVGSWTLKSDQNEMSVNCRWTTNRNFLVQTYSVSGGEASDLQGTQVIGWDPSRQVIRSWMFDSDGGFGSGAWSGEGDNWTVTTLQIVPTGEQATATNVYRRIDDNTMQFKSVGRQVGGKLMKNVPVAEFTRQ